MAETNPRKFIRRANPYTDAAGILEIYSPIVLNTHISFELEPPTLEEMTNRILKGISKYPWLVYEKDNIILGYAYASQYRSRIGYNWTVESSLYISPLAQKQGIGKTLYEVLFETLIRQGYYCVIAGMTIPNEGSNKVHVSAGFELFGVYRNIGFKNGQWWDTKWFQKNLRSYDEVPSKNPVPFSQIEF